MKHISKILSEELSNKFSNFKSIELLNDKELESVKSLRLSRNDIEYLNYFKNVEELELDIFPSINRDDIEYIASLLPDLKILKIQEQNAIFELDLSPLKKLEELILIHNDNLMKVTIPSNLNMLVFYDNKDFRDIYQIIDLLFKYPNCHFSLDIVYCIKIIRNLLNIENGKELIKNITWVESIGLRKYKTYEYTQEEIKYLIDYINYVVSKYIFVTDEDYEKFGILYKWMIDNIKFINEDEETTSMSYANNILEVFKYKTGGRLTFAKAFQFLLSFVDIDSAVVYSLGASETIGYYNGEKVYSLLGTSDYALLRVLLDNKYYYADIAWDSMVKDYKYFEKIKLFLVSREELKLRHKLVGEGNIEKTYSYNEDSALDLISFADTRIREVDEILNDIDRENINIDSAYINSKILYKDLDILSNKLNELDENDSQFRVVNKDISRLKNEIDVVEAQHMRYIQLRENILKSYTGYLLEHYIGTTLLTNKDVIKEILIVKKNNYVISEYMFNLINDCLK